MASRIVVRAGRAGPRYMEAAWVSSFCAPTATKLTAVLAANNRAAMSKHIHARVTESQDARRFFSDKATPAAEDPEEKTQVKEETKPETADGETAQENAADEPEISRQEQLEAEAKQLKDQLLRSLAEQENTRRIAQRDVQDARNFAVKSFAKSLLDVSDNLSRALAAVPEEVRHDAENHATLATLYEGIEMTEAGLLKAFEANGLKKFGHVGDTFDPNKHQALYEYPDSSKKPGTVGQVMKVGYLLNERVLRPAEVGVVKKE